MAAGEERVEASAPQNVAADAASNGEDRPVLSDLDLDVRVCDSGVADVAAEIEVEENA